jgi:hypothetical protein
MKQNSPQPNFHWGIGVDEATKTFGLKSARQQQKKNSLTTQYKY